MTKLFSIKNEYSDKIYANKKHVELRRQNVKLEKNEFCFIYTSSPIKKITGCFIVKKKIRLPINALWDKTKKYAGVTKDVFMDYFTGCTEGTAIFFMKVEKFVEGLNLNELRYLIHKFTPPQSYCNLTNEIYTILTKNLNCSIIKQYP